MLDEMNAKSSLLQRTEVTAGTVLRQHEVKVSTLDKEIDAIPVNSKDPAGVKIDTEGYELEVVKGLNCNLSRVAFILAEVSLMKRFESSYSFAEFINYMDCKGFSLADLLGFHPNNLPSWQDCLFLNQNFSMIIDSDAILVSDLKNTKTLRDKTTPLSSYRTISTR
jgi:hypothetical protein